MTCDLLNMLDSSAGALCSYCMFAFLCNVVDSQLAIQNQFALKLTREQYSLLTGTYSYRVPVTVHLLQAYTRANQAIEVELCSGIMTDMLSKYQAQVALLTVCKVHSLTRELTCLKGVYCFAMFFSNFESSLEMLDFHCSDTIDATKPDVLAFT